MDIYNVEWVTATDIGKVRGKNEDSVSVASYTNSVNRESVLINIFAISDGIGGKKRGEVASKIAVKTITSLLFENILEKVFTNVPEVINYSNDNSLEKPISNLMKIGFQEVNEKLLNVKKFNEELKTGTTLTCGVLINDVLTLGHIGDTRCYLFNENKLKQLTRDHTLSTDRNFKISSENREKYSNVLTRSLGNKRGVLPDIKVLVLNEGCKLLFCTDGLHREINEETIEEILSQKIPLKEMAKKLIEKALNNGGKDNISLILSKI